MKVYHCNACGSLTTGSRSPMADYTCCPACCERVDRHLDAGLATPPCYRDSGDRGPYEDRRPWPACPDCGGDAAELADEGRQLECPDCGCMWSPLLRKGVAA